MTEESTIEPISASADGKRNSHCLSCKTVGAQMNYAACLNRVKAVDSGAYPKDWSACASPSHGCPARTMRQEEILAGKAIYFKPRATLATAAATAGRWVTDTVKKVLPAFTTSAPAGSAAPAAPSKAKSMFDAMDDAGSLADAVTAAAGAMPKTMMVVKPQDAKAPAQVLHGLSTGVHPTHTPEYIRKTVAVALPGESPLQMALRLKKEREAVK